MEQNEKRKEQAKNSRKFSIIPKCEQSENGKKITPKMVNRS